MSRKSNAVDYINVKTEEGYPLEHLQSETHRINKFLRPFNLRFRLRGRGPRTQIKNYSREVPVHSAPRIAIYLEACNPEGQWSIVKKGDMHIKLTIGDINETAAKLSKNR